MIFVAPFCFKPNNRLTILHKVFCYSFLPKLHSYAPPFTVPKHQSHCCWCRIEFSEALWAFRGRGTLESSREGWAPSQPCHLPALGSRRNEVCLHHLVAPDNRAEGIFHLQHTSPTSLSNNNTDEPFAISGSSKWTQGMQKAHLPPGIKWEFSLNRFFPLTHEFYLPLPPSKALKSRILKK